MNEKDIITEYLGVTYKHGQIKVIEKDLFEWKVEIKAQLVVSSEEYSLLHEKIEKIVKEFAL